MSKKNSMLDIMRGVSYLPQLGLSVATPIILCLLAAQWLQARFGWGSWVSVVGLLIGLTSGLLSLLKFLLYIQKKSSHGAVDKQSETPKDGRNE